MKRSIQMGCLVLAMVVVHGCTTTKSDLPLTDPDIPAVSQLKERTGEVTLKGEPVTLLGPVLKAGDKAPPFIVQDAEGNRVSLLDLRSEGRVLVISAVPSVTTPVCSLQTYKFNAEAAKLPKSIRVITISADEINTQKSFCAEQSINRIDLLSDALNLEFGRQYGILIKDKNRLARSVWVITPYGKIVYSEIVSELTAHPDYETALAAARGLAHKRW